MIIRKIYIKNFRGIKELSLSELQPHVLFLGLNGAGKTSVLDAIRAALFGRVYDQRGKAIKVGEWIGCHGKTACVRLIIERGEDTYKVELNVTGKGSTLYAESIYVNGTCHPIEGSPQAVREAIFSDLGLDAQRSECSANPRAYFTGDGLADLLGHLGGGEVDSAALVALSGEHGTWLTQYLADHDITIRSVEDIDRLGKRVYASRTEVNTELKRVQSAQAGLGSMKATVSLDGKPLCADNLPEVKALLDDLCEDESRLYMEAGRSSSAPNREHVKGIMAETMKQLDMARKRKADTGNGLTAYVQADKVIDDNIQNLQSEHSNLRSAVALRSGELRKVAEDRKAFEAGQCPRCRTKLSEASIKKLCGDTSDIERDVEEKQSQLTLVEQRIQEYRAARKETKDVIDQARTQDIEAAKAVNALETKLGDLQDKLDAANVRPVDDVKAEVAEVHKRVETVKAAVSDLEKITQRDELGEQARFLLSQQGHLDWAVDAFEKGSLKQVLAAGGQEEFLAALNGIVDRFGFECSIDVQGKDVTLLAARLGGPAIPVWQLSQGEYLSIQFGLAMALGTGPSLVDAVDGLSYENKGILFDLLAYAGREASVWMAGALSVDVDSVPLIAESLQELGVDVVLMGFGEGALVVEEAAV